MLEFPSEPRESLVPYWFLLKHIKQTCKVFVSLLGFGYLNINVFCEFFQVNEIAFLVFW